MGAQRHAGSRIARCALLRTTAYAAPGNLDRSQGCEPPSGRKDAAGDGP